MSYSDGITCPCFGWVREYGVGLPGEVHHRNCKHWSREHKGAEVHTTKHELIVLGDPDGDESHNCDAMGCGTFSHVLFRFPLAAGVEGRPYNLPAEARERLSGGHIAKPDWDGVDVPLAPKLAVWFGPMPESNGKTNWTAILHRGDLASGHTIERSEHHDRVRYEADRVRWLIGELPEQPFVLDYNADMLSPPGYVHPCDVAVPAPAQQPTPLPDGTFLWDGRTPFSPSAFPAGVTEAQPQQEKNDVR